MAYAKKECGRCAEVKLITEYNKNSTRADGLQSYCKTCQKLYQKEWLQSLEDEERTEDLILDDVISGTFVSDDGRYQLSVTISLKGITNE